MDELFVVSVGDICLCFLGRHDTESISRCVVPGLADFVGLLVLTVRLHLSHLHIMDEFGIILKAAEAHELPFVLFIA